jgi:membrane protease YdiL (CAAX protease family)
VITDRQPVGWGRAVFVSVALFMLLFVVEALASSPLTHKHTSLVAGIAAALVIAGTVALILPLCFELAFANRLRDPAAFVTGLVTAYLTDLLQIPGTNEIATRHSSDGYKIAICVLAVIVAPWTEEVSIRGFLFSGLARRFGMWPAAFVSGFAWAGLHLVWGVLIIFTAEGMVLAWLRSRTGSVLPGIGIHGAWNTLASVESGGGWFPLPTLVLLLLTIYAAYRVFPAPRNGGWVR